MAIDREKYIGKYLDEAVENLTMVENLLFDIKDGVSVEDDLTTLLRALHTLKGSSRMLEFNRVETLSHALESVFIALREQRIGLTENAMKLILAALDALRAGFAIIQATKDDNIDIEIIKKELVALAVNEEFAVPIASQEQSADVLDELEEVYSEEEDAALESGEVKDRGVAAPDGPIPEETVPKPGQGKREEIKAESIRISLEKIDSIIRKTASLQSLEIAAKTIAMETAVMNDLVKDYSRLLKAAHSLDPALLISFRKLERFSGKITNALKNYAVDVGNNTKNVYDSVISLRMLPISTVLDTYPRYVYEMALEMGKKAQLTIEGKESEIDKNVIETISDVFLHMIRNSIDHGIESPQDRLSAGKSVTGQITIHCSRESGNMKIVISDDGRGLDYGRIRKRVVDLGFVTEAIAGSLSKEDLTSFIFQSGFSTSVAVSNVSGRGVGMDVVRSSIERLKGSITVESEIGKGTSFTILVPLSIAVMMGFPIACGSMKFIIPANFVDTILMVNKEDIITVVDRPEIRYENRIIKLYYLSQILWINKNSQEISREAFFVVIVRAYDDIIALVVDNINSMRSVILKNLPSFVETMPAFTGIVLSEDYEMVPALHIPTIIKMAKRIKGIDMKKRNIEFEKQRKSILVVDDSLPTREIESEILLAEGYKVDTAADGAEALTAAKNSSYDLICTDLNMPIMDGFMLTENIRKNEELSRIPIIVISSRESEEDQKRAAMLGASRYIIKNSFNNHNLVEAVRELIGEANE
jgi:chemotaxis protein histidine kinase CheA/CheY-like chemotaxis protein